MTEHLPPPGEFTSAQPAEELEHFFSCPHCWSTISILLDPGVKGQKYVEDCEVCCQPIEIDYRIQPDGSISFEAQLPG